MAVRSSKFVGVQVSGASQHTIYTCPSGGVTLVKSLAVFNNSGASGRYSVGAVDTSSGNRVDWNGRYTANPLGAGESETVLGWWVLEPGDVLFLLGIDAGPWGIWVSGARLS